MRRRWPCSPRWATVPGPSPTGLWGTLEGLRVVAFEQAVAMPFCSFVLAELGAEVVKIERPGSGDVVRGWDHVAGGLSSGFVWLSANKRDLCVDLGIEAGRAVVRRLAAQADVFLENFAPGVADRLGLGHEELRATHPGLVYCSLSGYGQDGPYRDVKAYDLLVQGESGILLTNGQPESPAKVGLPITDLIGGSTAAIAVLAALRQREATGEGAYLDLSMLDAAVPWLGYFPHHVWHEGVEPPRTGMRHQYLCPYGPYLAGDGRWVNLVVANARDWERFVTAVAQRPEWLADERFCSIEARRAHRQELEALVEATIAAEPSGRWLERLGAAGLAHGEVRNVAEVLAHPQLAHRQMLVEASSPVGTLPLLRFPLGDPSRERHVPALGEHSEAILRGAGYAADEVAALLDAGVVVSAARDGGGRTASC